MFASCMPVSVKEGKAKRKRRKIFLSYVYALFFFKNIFWNKRDYSTRKHTDYIIIGRAIEYVRKHRSFIEVLRKCCHGFGLFPL